MISANAKNMIKFLQDNAEGNYTAKDVAAALDLTPATINGCFTGAIQKKGLGFRQEAEVELSDGSHEKVKFLRLSDEGLTLDVDAEDAE